MVFYGWEGATKKTQDPGFGKAIQWDIPLLEGYEFEFVPNVAKFPGSSHFRGIDLPSLEQRMDKWCPDCLLVYGWSYKSHLLAMRHYHGKIPVLFRGDSTLLDEKSGFKKYLRRLLLRWVYSYIDYALYVGTQNRSYFLAQGLRDDQLIFAPHAIDNDRFLGLQDVEEKALKAREALGIDKDDLVFLFVGKLEPKKAPDLLLRCFKSISKQDAHLVFVGSGELEESLRKHANNNVHFVGFKNQSEMPAVYRIGDVVVLPSRGPGETWGLAINEAMACSRPVIASNKVGSASDLIKVGSNGWVFESNDKRALRSCLTEACRMSKKELGKLGGNSKQIISNWSYESQIKAIESCVAKATGRV